ncbi:MAG: hypothetical protein ABS939_17140 [Psychrobacillus sp.]
MNIMDRLKREFTIVKIDFYDNGEDVQYFVFNASEINEIDGYNLYEEYNSLYNNDKFDGAFEDYLQEKGVDYGVI